MVTLLAWALVEDGTSRNLVGFVQRPTIMEGPGWVILADEVDGFDGYYARPAPYTAERVSSSRSAVAELALVAP